MSGLRDAAHGKTVDKADAQGKELDFKPMNSLIRSMESQFKLAMPKGLEATQLVRDAMTSIRQTPKLLECSPESIMGGLMTFAQLGLRPGVSAIGHGWLIPFYDKKSRSQQAQVILGYKGLAELAFRSDMIAGLSARVVQEKDTWSVEYGTEDRIVHAPYRDGPRGKAVAYYVVAHIKGGRPGFEFMTHADVIEHRDRFAMAREGVWENGRRTGDKIGEDGHPVFTGPWRDDFDAMAKKTVFRRMANWLPRSTELHTALMADEGVRVDLNPQADLGDDTVTYHYEQVPNEAGAGQENVNE
jgi:recombination protein RecT